MVLLCAEGLQSKEVAERLGVHEHTVGKWRRRFVQDGIEGLTDEYRAGRPRTVSDAQVAQVIERTLNTTPKDATHWSIRSMAAETGLSHTTIRRIWAAFSLQPHRSETFKLSTDPLFVDKDQDIVGLYMSPPNRAVVLCVDEKSQIQALDREQPVLPMAPGVPEHRTHTYIRNGTTSLFAALDIATGAEIGKCYKRHRATEFLDFLKRIDAHMPEGPDVHLVMDNYATHKTPKIKAWLARRPHWCPSMSIRKMISLHPDVAGKLNEDLATAVRHAVFCAATCTSCADACVAEDMDMRQCIRSCLDCADICDAAAKVALRRTSENIAVLRAMLETCIRTCELCAEEFARHEHAHCRICAEMGRECAEDCRKALTAVQ